jgi:ATP-binding cassette subfamily F protein uup
LSYNVSRLDRLGIVGPNGSGKTTLFKTILGEVLPTSGTITIGETVKVGYLKQEDKILNSKTRINDYLKEFGENIETVNGTLTASQLLEDFLFSKNTQYMPISTLSGGEKRRLQLVRVLMKNPNVLILDEPTNDLDIYTIEILENYLDSFKGPILLISHDRYFLDKLANKLFVFEGTHIKEYNEAFSEYLEINNVQLKENTFKNKPIKNK